VKGRKELGEKVDVPYPQKLTQKDRASCLQTKKDELLDRLLERKKRSCFRERETILKNSRFWGLVCEREGMPAGPG